MIQEAENVLKLIPQQKLPGKEAQYKMAPENRKYDPAGWPEIKMPRDSGVLILIYPAENELHTVFIQRHHYQGVHSNQVSLPGGKYEKTDKDLYQTALRETSEELGIDTADIMFLSKLTPLFVPPSNFIIHPFVGYLPYRPVFHPDSKEVKSLFEVSFSEMLDEKKIQEKPILFSNGEWHPTPCFVWKAYIVWGATAMIMSEFIELLKKCSSNGNFSNAAAT